ncbi:MAG: type II toxin-antitoxin system PemK/MazF family toxin [Verrucomicrobiota bacterium]
MRLPLRREIKWPRCTTRRSVVPERGEVWLFDCGMVEKVRPVLVMSVPFADTDRSVVTVVFHSTTLRGSQFEIKVQAPFLKDGAFVTQSIATYPTVRAIRKLGVLNPAQLADVEAAVFKWLGRAT